MTLNVSIYKRKERANKLENWVENVPLYVYIYIESVIKTFEYLLTLKEVYPT